MSTHTGVFEIGDIKKFINSRGKEISSTSLEELLFGVFVAKFHSKAVYEEFKLGVPVKRGFAQELEKIEDIQDQIAYILKNWEDKDTPIDFFVIPENLDFSIKSNRRGYAYQLKRFQTIKDGSEITDKLLDYIKNEIPKKYAYIQAGLLLSIGADLERINLEKLKNSFSPDQYPFDLVAFIGRKDSNLVFCSIWPEFHKFEIDPMFLISDKVTG